MKKLLILLLLILPAVCDAAERTYYATYKLHGQTRRFELYFSPQADGGLTLRWRMERHGHWREGRYRMSAKAMRTADCMNYSQPIDLSDYTLKDNELFMMLSDGCYQAKTFSLNGLTFVPAGETTTTATFVNAKSGCTVEVLKEEGFHLIMRMERNPMNINWSVVKWAPASASLRDELTADPCKTASIYRAYPWHRNALDDAERMPGVLSPTPDGYEAFYISHYGRHGSRWLPDAKRYTRLIDIFDSLRNVAPLTPLGEQVYGVLTMARDDAKGREGALSSIGASQHRTIARRMMLRFPSVFTGTSKVEASSSTVMRCAMSMASFCTELKAGNPYLRINTECNERTLAIINNVTPEAKAMAKDKSWYADYEAYCRKVINGTRLCKSLFGDNRMTDEQKAEVMMELYWYASDMQDVSMGVSLYDSFTDDELYALWTTVNYRMYVCNTWCPLGKGTGPLCAKPLLADIISKAESAISNANSRIADSSANPSDATVADLRFGHDTALLRLLALMGIEGCTSRESNPALFAEVWQDFRISPMAANLQMVFYRNAEGNVIVKFLLNEEETTLPALKPSIAPCYYLWSDVRKIWEELEGDRRS